MPVTARLSTLFPLLLLALLAALTYWLDHTMQDPAASRDKRPAHEPDYTVEKLIATRMDVNGRVRDTLHTAKMVHFPDDDSTELTLPQFASFAHGAPLSIRAKQGEISSNGGNLYFRGDVRATRAAQGANSALVVTTEYLHVLPDDHIAKTDRPVTISDASMTIRAGGMELNSERQILKLHGGVRGVYHDANLPAPLAAGTKR
jgi:lipopolysaccharide export system protein LptC